MMLSYYVLHAEQEAVEGDIGKKPLQESTSENTF
jgi:hypothetical protein